MDRGAADPHLPGGGPRLHPALASSVSLAHRLHPAAVARDAAPRRGGREDARAANPTVPPFIAIGQNLEIGGESASLKAFHTARLPRDGIRTVPDPDPQDAASAVRPPAELGERALPQPAQAVRAAAAQQPVYQFGGDFQRESLLRSMDAADRLLTSPSAKAFDLSLEPKQNFDAYNTGRFGQGCLLARRLVEAGARYVEVTTEYIPFRYWDSHENGHERADDDEADRSTRRWRS